MIRRARLVLCIVILLTLILSVAFACSSDDPSQLSQTDPVGTLRIWVNAINNKSLTEVASCIYEASSPEYSQFVQDNLSGYAVFTQSQFIAITEYDQVGRNDAYCQYEVTLSIKRQITATMESGAATEALTTIDSITSLFHFRKTALNKWLFTTEPNPTSGNPAGEGFTLETEELAQIPVKFETNGGTAVPAQLVTEGNSILEPEAPVRSGYNFSGWYTGQSYKEAWDFNNAVTTADQEITLYAKWLCPENGNTISINAIRYFDEYNYSADNNYVVHAVKSQYDASGKQYSFSTGLEFSVAPDHWGVYLDKNGSEPTSKIIDLTPGQTTQCYVIITAPNGNDTVVYEFNIYLKRDYTLTYVEQGQPIEGVTATHIEEGDVINSFPDVTKAGYLLTGWTCDGLSVNENTIVNRDMVLTPVWDAKYQKVTLLCSGGTLLGDASIDITYGEIINVEVPQKTGYVFRHWTREGEVITNSQGTLLKPWEWYDRTNVVLQAMYDRQTYQISYSGVFGLGFEDITSYSYEQFSDNAPHVFNEPSKPGYRFDGWIPKNGNTSDPIRQIDSSVTGNLELEATWTALSYDVYYYTFSGSAYDESNITWQEVESMRDSKMYEDTLVDTPLTHQGLTFVGWYLDEQFTTLLTSSYRPEDTTNLYARWTEEYTQGLSFSFNKDGNYEVRQYGGTADTVVIPSTYLGVPVVSISAGCFSNQTFSSIDLSRATNLTSIGARAFENCSNLKSITIPSNVTSIGDGVFGGCSSLVSINLPKYSSKSASSLGRLFSTTRGDSIAMFYEASQEVSPGDVRTYYIPKTLTDVTIATSNITAGYMENMSSVKSITIGALEEGCTTIGIGAFRGCTELTTINIPATITAIGTEAFRGCTSLSSTFGISAGVTSIGKRAFYGVTIALALPNSLATLGDNAMEGYLGSTIEMSSVTVIGRECFRNASNLTTIDLSDVHTIGYGAFINCYKLSSIVLSDRLSSIQAETFSNCQALTSLTLSDNVSSIGSNAFYNCSNLVLTLSANTATDSSLVVKDAQHPNGILDIIRL